MKYTPCIVKFLFPAIAVSLLLTACNNPESDYRKAEQANTEQAYNDFIKQHGDSPLVGQAKAHIEHNAYSDAQKTSTIAGYEKFLERFATGQLAQQAQFELESLELAQATKAATIPSWEAFLQKYPKSTNSAQARQHLATLLIQRADNTPTVAGYREVATRFPGSEAAIDAIKRIEMLDYQAATNVGDIDAYEHFLVVHPVSTNAALVELKLKERLGISLSQGNGIDVLTSYLASHPGEHFNAIGALVSQFLLRQVEEANRQGKRVEHFIAPVSEYRGPRFTMEDASRHQNANKYLGVSEVLLFSDPTDKLEYGVQDSLYGPLDQYVYLKGKGVGISDNLVYCFGF
jgi:hypothetical protein